MQREPLKNMIRKKQKHNTPFVKAANSDGGYFFEYEEVPCATKYNEETDEAEYKEGYHNYFCIRFVR